MRFAPLFFVLILLLTACGRRAAAPSLSGDAEAQSKLTGNWILEVVRDGIHFKSFTTVASDGEYVSQLTDNGIRTFELEGTWLIKDGILTDTITKHSNTNTHLPIVSRDLIIRLDDQELIVKAKERPELQVVFRKDKQ